MTWHDPKIWLPNLDSHEKFKEGEGCYIMASDYCIVKISDGVALSRLSVWVCKDPGRATESEIIWTFDNSESRDVYNVDGWVFLDEFDEASYFDDLKKEENDNGR